MKKSKANIYILIMLLGTILYYSICFFNNGYSLDSIFFGDINDSFMDFFNCMYGWHGNPYVDTTINYPAFATLCYKLMYRFIPVDLKISSAFELRTISYAWIVFMLFNIITVWISFISIKKIIKSTSINGNLLALSLFLSVPVMYSFERGNIANLAFALTLFFVAYFDCENKYIKHLSYISLAIAAAIKIYPAIFGLILIRKKEWKNAIVLSLYGVFFFFAPFLLYGNNSFISFINNVFGFVDNVDEYGFGYNYSLANLKNIVSKVLNIRIPKTVFSFFMFAVIILVLYCFFTSKSKWKRSLCLSLLVIWIPSKSFVYTVLYLIIPFIFYLIESESGDDTEPICTVCFIIMFVPFALPVIKELSVRQWLLSYSYVFYFVSLFILGFYTVIKEDVRNADKILKHIKK